MDRDGIGIVDIVRWLAGNEDVQSVAARIRSRVRRTLANDFKSIADVRGMGSAHFDFTANGGHFTIEGEGCAFETVWSRAGEDVVYAYKDGVELLGIKSGCSDFPLSVEDIESFDFTRRVSAVGEGDVVVFMNKAGRFAAVKITGIHIASQDNVDNTLAINY